MTPDFQIGLVDVHNLMSYMYLLDLFFFFFAPLFFFRPVKEIQGRWKSIRDSYAKHMKKVQRVGANGLQSKSYIFAPHLTFLDKFLTCRVAEEQADTVAGGRNTGRSDFQQHRGEAQAAESDAQESSEEEEEEESDNQGRVEEERKDAHKFHRKLRVNLVPVKPDPESSQDLDTALDTSNSHDHGQSAAEDSKFDLWLLEDMVRRVVKETGVEKDADMAFFTMLLPTLRNFTEDQKLEFRTEVLLTMRAIKAGASKATLVSASTSATCTSSLH